MDARGQGLCEGGVRRGLGVHRLGAERGVVWAALGVRHHVPLPAAARGPRQGPHPRRADGPGRALRGARAGRHAGGDPGLPALGRWPP
eukprot:scaffold44965_cov31-Phaeocystis_antarctica.AAC.1